MPVMANVQRAAEYNGNGFKTKFQLTYNDQDYLELQIGYMTYIFEGEIVHENSRMNIT